MRRAVVALVLAAALGAGLGILAENGILLGRDESGPLGGGVGGLGVPDAPTEQAMILVQPVSIEGGPVDVDEIVPEFSSPGLEVLGPMLGDESQEPVGGEVGRWPPPRTRPIATLRDHDRLVFGLRVAGPGIYRFSGFTFRYRRGIRRFEHGDSTAVCILELPGHGDDACEPDLDPPAASTLAELGGPSDYGPGAKLGDGFDTAEMQIRAGLGKPVTLRLPIVNLSDDALTIERLVLPAPGTLAAPAEIPAHQMRQIEIRTQATCRQSNGSAIFGTLNAIVDGDEQEITLSTPIAIEQHCVHREP